MAKSLHKKPSLSDSILGNFSSAAVAIDGKPCAKVGTDVLLRNGTAVDAAIAALFCNSLYQSHSMGPGGGLLMTVYTKATGKIDTLIAREMAPLAATENMFNGQPDLAKYGGLSVAVPGQILGLYEAKERYGNPKVTWASLLQPAIDQSRYGIEVSRDCARNLEKHKQRVFENAGMREIFVDPQTNDVYKEGDVFVWPNLADTLEKIAVGGAQEFYSGQTAEKMVQDLTREGGIITKQDFLQYKTLWTAPVSVNLGPNLTLHSVAPPGSGAILGYILNTLKHFELGPDDDHTSLMYHRITEAYKWAYAQRTKLGDPYDQEIADFVHELTANLTSERFAFETFMNINDSYVTVNNASYYGADFYTPDDDGTTHLSIIAPNGDAVSATSTINHPFGSYVLSPQTGILFNDEMDDFSAPNVTNGFGVPPSPNNFIRPQKRPLSSTCPAIVVDNQTGDVRLVIGAAGGTKITSQTAYAALRYLWLDQNVKESVDETRIHHQLAPMVLFAENGLSQDIVDGLRERQHVVEMTSGAAVICAVAKGDDGRIYANADFRKDGGVSGF